MDASEQSPGTASPDLAPDAPTTRVPRDRAHVVALVGYLGEGSSEQNHRLYENVALNRWIEILVTDIVDRLPAPTVGQSLIWVRRDAELAMCESVRASSFEQPPQPDPGTPLPIRWPRP